MRLQETCPQCGCAHAVEIAAECIRDLGGEGRIHATVYTYRCEACKTPFTSEACGDASDPQNVELRLPLSGGPAP